MRRSVLLGTDADSDDLFDGLLSLEVGCLLHGDFAKGIDIHASVGKLDGVVLDFNLSKERLTF
jgi:hypothetical protein